MEETVKTVKFLKNSQLLAGKISKLEAKYDRSIAELEEDLHQMKMERAAVIDAYRTLVTTINKHGELSNLTTYRFIGSVFAFDNEYGESETNFGKLKVRETEIDVKVREEDGKFTVDGDQFADHQMPDGYLEEHGKELKKNTYKLKVCEIKIEIEKLKEI